MNNAEESVNLSIVTATDPDEAFNCDEATILQVDAINSVSELLPVPTDFIPGISASMMGAGESEASMSKLSPTVAKPEESASGLDEEQGSTGVMPEQISASSHTSATYTPPVLTPEIWEPAEYDVLTGRGASVNLHPGNQKFRALCYARKPLFDAANHAAKKRIATEIWTTCEQLYQSRFLTKRELKGPWYQQSSHQAILKAAQTIRDYQRQDRVEQRALVSSKSTRKRRLTPATPMDDVVVPPPPDGPIVENPDGVESNDVLCGRGAVSLSYYNILDHVLCEHD
jgi:hypothetical protein